MPKRERLVSGGQTGADRAALDRAIERGIPHGGGCPRASSDPGVYAYVRALLEAIG